jgi:hypothetical protein
MNKEFHFNIVKTKQQMADEYGICTKTFDKLLRKKRINLDRGLIYPKDQLMIYSTLGIPESIQKLQIVSQNSV